MIWYLNVAYFEVFELLRKKFTHLAEFVALNLVYDLTGNENVLLL